MLRRLRKTLAQVKEQKFQKFADFEPIIKKIVGEYGHLFPRFEETKRGSHRVYHFNVLGVSPITLAKEHGNHDFIPRKFAKYAIQGIEDVLDFIETNTPDEPALEKENENASPVADQEAARALPDPKIPDGDS
jgi:hypothetical protein